MKNKENLPHIITVLSLVVLIVLGLACASAPPPSPKSPMTKAVGYDVASYGGSFDNFRFSVSTDVILTKVDRSVTASKDAVLETVVRNIINLPANTQGRLFSGDVDTELKVYFEPSKTAGAAPDTFAFVEKPGEGNRFYFKYEQHPTLSHVVNYQGVQYQVTWEGSEEPYLLYVLLKQEKTNARTMGGVK